MKLIKHFTSAMLSVAIIAGAAATGLSTKIDTNAANDVLMYETVLSNWQSRINAEKAKFPNGAYWNHKGKSSYDENTYSYTPCNHTPEKVKGACQCSKTYTPPARLSDWSLTDSGTVGQCYGFASKLAQDIWGTTQFIHGTINSNYEPKVGDNVRLSFSVKTSAGSKAQPHSIFITGISGENITFADCNGDLEDCKIKWDQTRYYQSVDAFDVQYPDKNGVMQKAILYKGNANSRITVTKTYLREHGVFFERPAISGDLNMNGMLDSGDAGIFESTVMQDGRTARSNWAPLSFYDVNGDGYVNTDDYNEIRYGRNNLRIIRSNENVTCRWKSCNHINGFLFNDGSYYVKNDIGGVSWIGTLDSEVTNLTVSSRVYCPSDKTWYDVTEIGYEARGNGGGYRTCTANTKIQTFTIPDTVKKIHSYAFDGGALRSFYFGGSNSQLETIDNYAFYNCKSLTFIDLRKAKNLTTIGDNAFEGCDKLRYIDLPFTPSINIGTSAKGSIFGNNKTNSTTLYVNNPNNAASPASNYQVLKFGSKDLNYWTDGQVKMYGKLFKVYLRDQYISQKGIYQGFLNPPQ
ncbi:leucine-rich repeat protein [Ruminococcus flavefaciens]|uniref:Dockerin domain-containing protein n=1 Tax=Ruminococcus flavefaciens 007c TaxID=1341157 RepID=W7UTX8_RUMFL|nr:leucine-rich repeat protein [Ruminococcus flavefaciens]EWM52270.1 hypothetical protein RF007C_13030 [Ruminococcus flavefaciens 007c]